MGLKKYLCQNLINFANLIKSKFVFNKTETEYVLLLKPN